MASAEIQTAARKVVDENKRLRQLLKQRGLSDAEIDGLPANTSENPAYSTSATALEGMLDLKKPCRSSSGDVGTTPGGHYLPPPLTSQQTLQSGSREQSAPTSVSPDTMHGEIASLHSSIASAAPTIHATQPPFEALPATFSAASETTYQTLPDDGTPFSEVLDWSDLFPPSRPSPEHMKTTSQLSPTEYSSCYAAADAIRRVNPDLGCELEEALGCCNGSECEVANNQVFNTMERYMDTT